jgi:polyhydroxyalkanoate synthesis regulator phasin
VLTLNRLRVENLQPEQEKWMKKSVVDYVAPAHGGIVTLSLMLRLFGDLAQDRHEVRRIMDSFVSEGLARSKTIEGDVKYIFPGMIREVGEADERELRNLKKSYENLRSEIEELNSKRQALDELSDIWSSGWDKWIPDRNERAVMLNFISSYWRKHEKRFLAETSLKTTEIKAIKERIGSLEEKADQSWIE